MELLSAHLDNAEQQKNYHWFWIIDGCAHPAIQGLLQNEAAAEAWPLHMNTYMEDVRAAGPWFVRHAPGGKLGDWMLEHLEECPAGFLLKGTHGDEQMLFDHFQQLLECTMPDGGDGVFRYYDPRMLYGITTSGDMDMVKLVCGPACDIYAWEPGRAVPVNFTRRSQGYILCEEPPQLRQELLDHLWMEAQCHTIVSTLGGEIGEELRNRPLREAYGTVASIQAVMRRTRYRDNQDVALAVAYASHTGSQVPLQHVVVSILAGAYPPDQSFEDIISRELDKSL